LGIPSIFAEQYLNMQDRDLQATAVSLLPLKSSIEERIGMDNAAPAPGATWDDAARRLCEIGREFYGRGWVYGTSGNFSVKISASPLRLAITSSGLDKGALTPADILEIDSGAIVLRGDGRPSAETSLHLVLVGQRGAGAVLHTHSIWSTLLSDRFAAEGGFALEGYEMLKGLAGISTHEHGEWVPILQNSQDYAALSAALSRVLKERADCHGVLLRRHGLYTWGCDLAEARRHVEILEFLFEAEARMQFAHHP
jgi:methylthioribulose-1-phosphate dehydratase